MRPLTNKHLKPEMNTLHLELFQSHGDMRVIERFFQMNPTKEKVKLYVKTWGTIISITALFGGIIYGVIVSEAIKRRNEAKQQAAYHLAWCTPAHDFFLNRFDALDTDKDGLLTDEELAAASQIAGNPDEINFFAYARSYKDRIGHVIGTASHLETWVIPNGHGTRSLRRVYRNIYGISKDDLSTYPDRIKAEFGNL